MSKFYILQELWSGYGKILRIHLKGDGLSSVIVKQIQPPEQSRHPRGWDTSTSNQRKLTSYQVERRWYRDWSSRCHDGCRVPQLMAETEREGEVLLIMEDLAANGFPHTVTSVSDGQVQACLTWLAEFHATFMQEKPDDLWETGTYWHLATRQDELDRLDDLELKQTASAIDKKLNAARFQTIVHGDAKLANFCFSNSGLEVAAVDFQYVGGGCGMKDLSYFIGSCFHEDECEKKEVTLLEFYFHKLRDAISVQHPEIDATEVEKEWRTLFPVAWADFHRFLKGWSPGHWKLNSYSDRLTRETINALSSS